jgi:hypothetical protein
MQNYGNIPGAQPEHWRRTMLKRIFVAVMLLLIFRLALAERRSSVAGRD